MRGDGHGHGCGHNLLGSAALLAATAVKDYLEANGLKGRVRYYGCPAEEGGAAKAFMVRAGAFEDVDIAISWHPAAFSGVNEAISLANTRIDFTFTGRAAHAAAAPHLGRSALDAVELMNVGVNYMREHMPSDARIHYALLDAGGIAPNVVQATAKVRYLIRARDLPELQTLDRARAQDRGRRGADDGDLGLDQGGQRGLEPAWATAARGGDAAQSRPARPAALRRGGQRIRAQDPGDADRRGYRHRLPPRRRGAAAIRRSATASFRSTRRARRWWARPMSAM